MRAVREERDEEQAEFAMRLNEAAAALNLPGRYDGFAVSRRETGRKALDAQDFATVAMLDPKRRGWMWVAFGKAVTVGKDARALLVGDEGKRRAG